jgi:hypothetical protein
MFAGAARARVDCLPVLATWVICSKNLEFFDGMISLSNQTSL